MEVSKFIVGQPSTTARNPTSPITSTNPILRILLVSCRSRILGYGRYVKP